MATSHHDTAGKALMLLLEHLRPFVHGEMQRVHGDDWRPRAEGYLRRHEGAPVGSPADWDLIDLVEIVVAEWNQCFRKRLSPADKTMLFEARATRNQWAHQRKFTADDAYRILDTVQRLLLDLDALPAAEKADQLKQQVLIDKQRAQARTAREQAKKRSSTEGTPQEGLISWRDIIEPHPDVAAGTFAQAEFAADLAKVHRGDGGPEYGDPRQFFQRTYLTEGLQSLLINGLKRLHGQAGDPVIELQTNFGGGKTHSMLALYHLTDPAVNAGNLDGMAEVLEKAGVDGMPQVARAVLVGTAISPGEKRPKPDGTTVQTLWGELAWQLGDSVGKTAEAMAVVAENDANRTPPGSDRLVELFKLVGPSLVLIDEWVAYVRHTYERTDLPGGSFDSNLTFAQSLTEAAAGVDDALLVASLPQSDIEVGGDGGVQALKRLENTFGRKESNWKPANSDESYEIVRRRLFETIPSDKMPAKEAVADAFVKLYEKNPKDFPADSRDPNYRKRLDSAYPIHPELFERLYNDWSTLEQFQRTRGVLRLMAKVIHALWTRGDGSLLIMPGMVPIDDDGVEHELVRYLPDNWSPILHSEVDGAGALATRIDGEKPAYGRYWAARRAARTVYIGSAPTLGAATRGIDLDRVRLGCVQPGEAIPTFGDALQSIVRESTHLYADQSRFWYSTEANVTRVANDRAARFEDDVVDAWIESRMQAEQKNRGVFGRVHACPAESSDVPDDDEARLVILGPAAPHASGGDESSSQAMAAARQIFEQRGNSPRLNRNTVVFAAADVARLGPLRTGVRSLMAWSSICDEREELNLNTFNQKLAEKNQQDAERTVEARLPEAFGWVIVPTQDEPTSPVVLAASRMSGSGTIAERASARLRRDEAILETFGGVPLRLALDRIDWHGKDALGVRQVMEWFAQYVYFPRLVTTKLVIRAIEDGVAKLTWQADTFGYAQRYEAGETGKLKMIQGIVAGAHPKVLADGSDVIVRAAVARQWLDEFEAAREQRDYDDHMEAASMEFQLQQQDSEQDAQGQEGSNLDPTNIKPKRGDQDASTAPSTRLRKRGFYGRIVTDPSKLTKDAASAAQNVIAHLAALEAAGIEIVLEIKADVPSGIDDATQRTVGENCRTLKFEHFEFED
ncbi:Swt1 family HEPN domain-containing protein [bacterium]|nr:Swt1 family HEPN domain-containing protein [bacterium]